MPRWPYHHPASDRSDCICFERNGRSPGNRVHSKGLFWTGGQPHELSKYPRNGRRREVVGVAIFYDGGQARELDEPLEWAAAKKVGAFRLLYPHRTGSVGVLHG